MSSPELVQGINSPSELRDIQVVRSSAVYAISTGRSEAYGVKHRAICDGGPTMRNATSSAETQIFRMLRGLDSDESHRKRCMRLTKMSQKPLSSSG